MAAKSSRGTKVCITSAVPALNTPINPTAIAAVAATSTARAAVKVTVANTAAVGDVVSFKNTGFASLDGKSFVITAVAATDFTIGNVVLGTGTLSVSPKPEALLFVESTDVTCLCLSSVTINEDTPGTVSVATFCDPTASIPASATAAGTISFAGYVDTVGKDYPALLDAVNDGLVRILRIQFPNNGYVVAPVTFSSITWDIPLDGAIGFSGSGALGSKPIHVW